MRISQMVNHDLEKIRHLQPDDWPDITLDYKFYSENKFCLPVKVVIGKRIVGVGASIVLGKTAWLGHIIVNPDYRRRGIGFLIVKKLLTDLKNAGIETCSLIATGLGRNVYFKAGFREITEYVFFKREPEKNDNPFHENIFPFQEKYSEAILEMDKQISGEDRRVLLNGIIKSSWLYLDNGLMLGYYLPKLKEGMIYATEPVAGVELMKYKYSRINKAVLPADNTDGIRFLKQNQFIETGRTGTRMEWGSSLNWKPSKIYSRISGNLG